MTDVLMDHRTALRRAGEVYAAVLEARKTLALPDLALDPRCSMEDRVNGAMVRAELEEAIAIGLEENELLFAAQRLAEPWPAQEPLVLGKLPTWVHVEAAAMTMHGGR